MNPELLKQREWFQKRFNELGVEISDDKIDEMALEAIKNRDELLKNIATKIDFQKIIDRIDYWKRHWNLYEKDHKEGITQIEKTTSQ